MLSLLSTFGQSYDYSYSLDQSTSSASSASAGVTMVILLIYLAVVAIIIVAMWKLFTKARQPGWAAIVPIYNTVVMLKIVGRPIWWIVLLLIPFVNFIVVLILAHDTAKAFGKDIGTTLLLIFLPFIGYPMLAFGNAQYVGPVAAGGAGVAPAPGAYMPPAPAADMTQPQAPAQPVAPAPAPGSDNNPQNPQQPQGPTTPSVG
ncbi:MAG TPA: DUF5684 domain-containing protein [Ktedonobacteraceae bacterium]|nr:DUF5684 domain-containing protein [Ktedonobacteraceae bacterium]